MTNYSEHGKLKKLGVDTQSYGYFLEWLMRRFTFCNYDDNTTLYWQEHVDVNKILAEYFEIDYNKLMEEKEQMLDELRLTQ